MSLQGTLETIPLPDVLVLLAATKKTGELRITGARGDGRLWFDTGRVIAADVPRAATPVDAVFELLRLSAGSFTFGDGAPRDVRAEPLAVEALLNEAQQRLSAWQAIEAVVPSMACTLRLTPELAADSVTVSRQQWRELVAVAGGADVNGTMRSLGIGEFDACRTVKELVDAGLVQVGKVPVAPAVPPERRPPAPAASSPEHTPAARSERATEVEVPAPIRRPAPGPAPAPARTGGTGAAAPPAPASGRAIAAPAAAANGGRSAAPRRAPDHASGREETDERQATTHVRAHAKAAPARADKAPGGAAGGENNPSAAHEEEHDDDESAEGDGDEPINRGMLLKFLSSVRP